jgi:concanavalin A-like lectin/glucanase superfamily protein
VIGLGVVSACGRIGFDTDTDAIDPTLIAWLPLDDPPAFVYRDATGHGHTATCAACPTPTTGPFGDAATAAHFDGMTACLQIAPGVDLPAPYSMTLWVRAEVVPAFFQNFIGRPFDTSTEDTYAIDLFSDGTAEFFSPIQEHLHGTIPLPLNTWVHVAATFDGSTKKLFIAGALDLSAPFAGAMPSDAHPTYLGCDSDDDALSGFLQGSLADVRLYGRALPDAELASLAMP